MLLGPGTTDTQTTQNISYSIDVTFITLLITLVSPYLFCAKPLV